MCSKPRCDRGSKIFVRRRRSPTAAFVRQPSRVSTRAPRRRQTTSTRTTFPGSSNTVRLFFVLEVRSRVHRHDWHESFPPVFLPDALAVSGGVPTREMLSSPSVSAGGSSLVTNAPSGVVTEADLGARYTEPSVVERGDPLMRNGGLRHRQWNEARADGTVQAILDSIFRIGN